ncbi:Endonuclease/exonuclease/phosphatase [Zychaea mexicana]|uniref:Endonuclease/exonuclease/phosphatase n=1 Tax=Zychaea mexicana TaxID=64656 RepID=UPI0022FE31B6|nr:Endonuclease/exonuclease/phosphatase [Zychaea mexicana]KAI9493181.1 Endonuclease/exonuclease/phosphatase [Zychaea mexicana]
MIPTSSIALSSFSKANKRSPSSSTARRTGRRCCCCRLSLCLVITTLLTVAFFIWGLLYFSPATLPEPTVPDKSTDTNARFLTLNIFMRPPGVKNNKSDYKEQRLDYIIKHILPHYDVITVQEAFAFANRRVDRLAVAAREMGFNYQVASPRHYPWQLAADGGLLLLSRFPIAKSDVIEFPRGLHSDWLSYKGALHALVELNPRRSVHVYTTHTQASYDSQGQLNDDDTNMRLSQFAYVHKFISETARDDGSPVLIMGDLNVDASKHDQEKVAHAVHSSDAYIKMVSILNGTGLPNGDYEDSWHIDTMKDAVYEQFGYHPVTFGNVIADKDGGSDIKPAETVLTHWDQVTTVQSLDRIFWADRFSDTLALNNITIEKFLVADNKDLAEEEKKDIEFTQISDHYGLSCLIELI